MKAQRLFGFHRDDVADAIAQFRSRNVISGDEHDGHAESTGLCRAYLAFTHIVSVDRNACERGAGDGVSTYSGRAARRSMVANHDRCVEGRIETSHHGAVPWP